MYTYYKLNIFSLASQANSDFQKWLSSHPLLLAIPSTSAKGQFPPGEGLHALPEMLESQLNGFQALGDLNF